MTCETLTEAVFRLGQISADDNATNQSLFTRITQVTAEVSGADIFFAAVFEHGVFNPPKAVRVVGSWSGNEAERFRNQLAWVVEDRLLLHALSDVPRNELHRRSELVDDAVYLTSRLYLDIDQPLDIGDQAVGIFTRPDGTDLMLGFAMIGIESSLPRQVMARARSIAPYSAHCWAKAWKREPAWVVKLKPQTKHVLELVLEGYDDDQISKRMDVSYHSVRAHLKRLFREAGVRSRLHLMQAFRQIGPAKPWEDEAWKGDSNFAVLSDPSESAFGFTMSQAS